MKERDIPMEEFSRLEMYGMAVIQAARASNLHNLSNAISSLETYMTDTLDWVFCHHCQLFNKAKNFLGEGDGLALCPECGWEVE